MSGAPSSLPLEGKVPPKGADEVSPHSGVKRPRPARSQRRGYFAPRRELLLSAVTKVAKNTGRNCVSALPQRATPVRFRPRFPSRNRRFPDRCRSPDCASTAFRCRCLLLRQKLFVLPCRRLLYPVPDGHTYLCRRRAAKARFDNRQPGRSKYPYRGWGKRSRQPPRR